MSILQQQTGYRTGAAISAGETERAEFIRRTYTTLFLAVLAFVGIEAVLIQTGIANALAATIFSWGSIGWLGVLGAFMLVGTMATSMAHSQSQGTQLAGLSLYVGIEALIFAPMLALASQYSPEAIPSAGLVTLLIFAALTGFVLVTKKDFSFLRTFLFMASIAAIGAIISTTLLGWTMGVMFSVVMVVIAAGYILYNTSNVLHQYGTDQHIGAATALFASLALLFWYVLRIFMSRD